MSFVMLMLLLQVKHFVVDWCWQPEYEWKNKGKYGHFGGVRHAFLKNGVGTSLCFLPFLLSFGSLLLIFLIDGLIHYHVDWAKMNMNAKYGWKSEKNNEFWILTGLDQMLHQMTYLFLIWIFMV